MGACLVLLLRVRVLAAVPLGVYLLLAVLVLVARPYRRMFNNARQVCNCLVAAAVLCVYLLCTLSEEATVNS